MEEEKQMSKKNKGEDVLKRDRQKEIVDLLTSNKRLSTTRIANLLLMDYYRTLEILEKMKAENKVKKDVETNAVYWTL